MAAASTLRNVEGPFRITWLNTETARRMPGHARLRLVPSFDFGQGAPSVGRGAEPQKDKYEELAIRRRRAQMAARKALDLK